jgi:hypothetical protein
VLQALRIPDFRLLWGGSLISSFGSWLLVLAIPAHILMATGSLRDTGSPLPRNTCHCWCSARSPACSRTGGIGGA